MVTQLLLISFQVRSESLILLFADAQICFSVSVGESFGTLFGVLAFHLNILNTSQRITTMSTHDRLNSCTGANCYNRNAGQ